MGNNDLHFPFEYKELEPEENEEIKRLHQSPYMDYVRLGPKGYIVFRTYMEGAAEIYNMPVRPDDLFIITFQRSGTTWTQELLWLLQNDFDYATAKATSILKRYHFLEFFMFYKRWAEDQVKSPSGAKQEVLESVDFMTKPVTDVLLAASSPRYIKTHTPLSLLPPSLVDTARVVYVARDPRDVAVSSYHMARLLTVVQYTGTFKQFWSMFQRGLVTQTPFFEHVKEAWQKRHHPNMLFLFYEELSKDLPAAINRVAEFLGKTVSAEEMTRLCDHLSFDSFRKNRALNFEEKRDAGILCQNESFIRKGKAGGWRDYFDEEMSLEAERWIEHNLRDTDLRFPST